MSYTWIICEEFDIHLSRVLYIYISKRQVMDLNVKDVTAKYSFARMNG